MAVRIRMKMLGRRHRPFFRIVAIDGRQPRNGRELEELGTYDPMVAKSDGRITLNPDRYRYWLSVGAKASDRVQVLFAKYEKQAKEKPAAPAEAAPAPAGQ
jgi:small subunit ribosomal protein S16